ncbi:unnamed protein product, partial [marine sediment metagenome]
FVKEGQSVSMYPRRTSMYSRGPSETNQRKSSNRTDRTTANVAVGHR